MKHILFIILIVNPCLFAQSSVSDFKEKTIAQDKLFKITNYVIKFSEEEEYKYLYYLTDAIAYEINNRNITVVAICSKGIMYNPWFLLQSRYGEILEYKDVKVYNAS